MTTDSTNRDQAILPPEGPTPPTSQRTVGGNQLAEKRKARIQKHLEASLDSPDTLRACLGPVASDLLEMCHELKLAIDDSLEVDAGRSDRLRTLMPGLQVYLKTVQMTERLARLDVRLGEVASQRTG
jgi:hypothetical protein